MEAFRKNEQDMPEKIIISALESYHEKDFFDCGESILNDYLKKYAFQDVKRKLSQHFVATEIDKNKIIGYYSLSSASEDFSNLPDELKRNLPKYPVPLARLSRLAVDLRYQRVGLGKFLLIDSMRRVLRASSEIGIHGFIVDAKHSKAKEFYEKFGFIEFPSNPLTLILPMKTIQKAFSN